jgi:hypothetical protein
MPNSPTAPQPELPDIIREECGVTSPSGLHRYTRAHAFALVDLTDMLATRGLDPDATTGVTGLGAAAALLKENFRDTTTLMDGGARLDDLG